MKSMAMPATAAVPSRPPCGGRGLKSSGKFKATASTAVAPRVGGVG